VGSNVGPNVILTLSKNDYTREGFSMHIAQTTVAEMYKLID